MPKAKAAPKSKKRVLSFDIGVRNLSYCDVRFALGTKSAAEQNRCYRNVVIENWECVDIMRECGSTAKNPYSLGSNRLVYFMIQCLHRRFGECFADPEKAPTAVVVEEQPGRSMRMKVLGYAVVSYFSTLSVMQNLNLRVETISAKYKLQLCDEIGISKERPALRKSSRPEPATAKARKQRDKGRLYRTNKWRGVEGCKALLLQVQVSDELRERFQKSKKKDDLADTLLQAVSYYYK
jgi:hypothetical protein